MAIMRGAKKFFDPSYVPMRFFEAAPGCVCVIETFFFAGFAFLHQNETTEG
jgi:hypothetical protein